MNKLAMMKTHPSTIIPFLRWKISQRLCEQTGHPNVDIGRKASTILISREATMLSAIHAN